MLTIKKLLFHPVFRCKTHLNLFRFVPSILYTSGGIAKVPIDMLEPILSSSLIMGVFFKFGTSPLYQSQVLFLSFNFMWISSQKIFGKCKTKGVKGQGVKYDPPKGVKISKWSKLILIADLDSSQKSSIRK